MSTQKSRLTDEVDRLDENVNGLFAQLSELKDRVEELEAENEELRSQLAETETKADRALGVAKQVDNGERADGGPSKKRRAQLLSRDETVRRALVDSGRGGAVTASQVKDMALPEVQLHWQTIRDAWESLVATWDVFEIDEQNDPVRLTVDRRDLEDREELVGAVERNLDRDDLAKRLVGGRS